MQDGSHTESHTRAIQQTKVKKTFRLNADLISELEEHAEAHGMTVTAAVEDAIRRAIQESYTEPYESHTPDATLDALIGQLAVKDAQITALNDSLKAAQEVSKAAQMLHAAAGRDAQALPDVPEDWRDKTLLARIFKR